VTKMTRGSFLGKTAAATATLGALLAMPGVSDAALPAPSSFGLTKEELAGPVVVHVRDFATGEMAILAGTREIVFRDREFVNRLRRAVRSSAK